MITDSHHHYWHYAAAEFDWVGDDRLRRDFLPNDFAVTLKDNGIDRVITVQARQSEAETRWLLELANIRSEIAAVVGWVPLESADIRPTLEAFAMNPKFRGVRHILQGEADDDFMLRDNFRAGIAALLPFDLVYDLLILPRHLPNAARLVDAFPEQTFVLDHLAKPLEGTGFDAWAASFRDLARRPNVFCKMSAGAIEIDSAQATLSAMRPFFDLAMEAFTPRRLMFGSNWPLTEVAGGYVNWYRIVQNYAQRLTVTDRDFLFDRTATMAYGLKSL